MPYADRCALIQAVEAARTSRVLCYFLSDRETFPAGIPGFSTNLASEPQLLLVDLLGQVGHVPRLDLFLYTRGGGTDTVWPMVTALRAHTDHLSVLVPWRAHSAGTLICMGADEVVMLDEAELSPIDPTTGNQFNPRDPTNPGVQFGVSVEDVTAYFELAREQVAKERGKAIEEQSRLEVFRLLSGQVHPLALGNVQRVYTQIRRIGRRLLKLHLADAEDAELDTIVKGLTTEFYSHLHAISRDEAVELMGDWVKAAAETEALAIRELFEAYAGLFQLRNKFNLPEFMKDDAVKDLPALGAVIETTGSSFIYRTDVKVMQRPNLPAGVQVQVPPGQPVPLVPWVSRSYEWGIQRLGWLPNQGGE